MKIFIPLILIVLAFSSCANQETEKEQDNHEESSRKMNPIHYL